MWLELSFVGTANVVHEKIVYILEIYGVLSYEIVFIGATGTLMMQCKL